MTNLFCMFCFILLLNILGVFQAVQLKNDCGQTDMYVDGGLVCNYPIHAFDGTLAMKDNY